MGVALLNVLSWRTIGAACMYGLLNKLFDWLGTHGAVFCVGLGMGLYRCAHEWPV